MIDFEWVYIEVTDRNQIRYSMLLSAKLLLHIITTNPYEVNNNQKMLKSP
jgi:hypothetical protein